MQEKGPERGVSQVTVQALGGFQGHSAAGHKESAAAHSACVVERSALPSCLAAMLHRGATAKPNRPILHHTHTNTHIAPSLNLDFILISPQSVGVGFYFSSLTQPSSAVPFTLFCLITLLVDLTVCRRVLVPKFSTSRIPFFCQCKCNICPIRLLLHFFCVLYPYCLNFCPTTIRNAFFLHCAMKDDS